MPKKPEQRTAKPLAYLRRYPPRDEFDYPVWVRLVGLIPTALLLWLMWKML